MTLNQFLDAAYALLVQEHVRIGASLIEALSNTREYAAGFKEEEEEELIPAGGNTPALRSLPQLTPEELANEQSLAAFEELMGGVGFA
jgi:hypothetical protein